MGYNDYEPTDYKAKARNKAEAEKLRVHLCRADPFVDVDNYGYGCTVRTLVQATPEGVAKLRHLADLLESHLR